MRRRPRAEVVLRRGDLEVKSWPLWADERLNLSVVDDLARLRLTAGRLGLSVGLRHACPDLIALLQLAGLAGVVPAVSSGEVGREAERGEQGGVEEVVVLDDPVA